MGLAGAALGGVAAGQLGQAAGVVEAAEIAGQREQVDAANVAQAADLAAQPAEAGALEGGQHAPVNDRDHPLDSEHLLGSESELDAQDGGGHLVGVGGRLGRTPDALGHPAQEAAVAVLLAQPAGELVEGQGGDLERGQAEAQGGLEVGAGDEGGVARIRSRAG